MSIILPYNEEINKHTGTFINPYGEIIYYKRSSLYRFACHEATAQEFLCGNDKEFIAMARYFSPSELKFEDYHGNLSKSDYELFKLWISKQATLKDLASDFMFFVLSFDRVMSVREKAIATTNPNPHIRFWNYYLMDFDIYSDTKKRYNAKTDRFEWMRDIGSMSNSDDEEAASKIVNIKKRYLRKEDRYQFLR